MRAGRRPAPDRLFFMHLECVAMLVCASLVACSAPPEPSTPRGFNTAALAQRRWDEVFLQRVAEMAALSERGRYRVVFLGDSITQRWADAGRVVWNRYYRELPAANFGINGDRTQQVIWRIQSGAFDAMDPEVIVLMIGTNNTGENSAEQIAEAIGLIIDLLHQRLTQVQVLLLAVFPKAPFPTSLERIQVQQLNALLPALAQRERVHYLDISDTFLGPDGTLSPRVSPDFLHLNSESYLMWANAMAPKLSELLQR